ncbi:hypothetical protein [Pedobacter steynii]|uniref:hypothetical protein n=1 Tax=Pedobacter steynii TaxID=430522 RepID=UPI001F15E01E|nr:hypothetical protein [Pedobacter steynii]
MGSITADWQLNFVAALQEKGIAFKEGEDRLVLLDKGQVAINMVSLQNNVDPEKLIDLQTDCQKKNIYLVHLWEDIWKTRRNQVLGRIASILGQNKTLHGRKAKVLVINQAEADEFLEENHLQASAKARYKFALDIDGQMVAVALFSGGRPMNRIAADYRSYELIRFASLIGYTVTGGFSKLLKHFINLVQPNDLMSYADKDWSLGNAYDLSGFKLVKESPAVDIWLNRKDDKRVFTHRLPIPLQSAMKEMAKEEQQQFLLENDYIRVFNTGNLKYILYF